MDELKVSESSAIGSTISTLYQNPETGPILVVKRCENLKSTIMMHLWTSWFIVRFLRSV